MNRPGHLTRRSLLGAGTALAAGAGLGAMALPGLAANDEYRALVVLYLNGGSDGNNTLIPTDPGAFSEYTAARQNLAMLRQSLTDLPGKVDGRSYAMHPSLQPLLQRYQQGRLGFIANVGPLIEPATAQQVLDSAVDIPPFLLSHSDQTAIVQGWTVQDDMSGWAGRALETLPSRLLHGTQALTMSSDRTLVLGRRSPVSFLPNGASSWWGMGDLRRPQDLGTQSLQRIAQWQFANAYEAEYARSFGRVLSDAGYFVSAYERARLPDGDWGSDTFLASSLRNVAGLLPVFKADGLKRQVLLLQWGGFDTHANQRGTDTMTQDAQFINLAKALNAFDAANVASGMSDNVVTLVMSEFGRTVRPGSGGGSEHAWGSHWMLLGGPVAGGTVHGTFPSLILGGPDDADPGRNGRHVPSTSSDQVGASLMQWIGMPASQVHDAFPFLVNFQKKTLPLLRV